MIEIQCTSCYTRYRIDERILPEETPTFKCSRCSHVFSIDPQALKAAAAAAPKPEPKTEPEAPPVPPTVATPPPPAPPEAPPPVESRISPFADLAASRKQAAPPPEPQPQEDPLSKPFTPTFEESPKEEPKGENLTFDFRDEQRSAPGEPEPSAEPSEIEDRWEVGTARPDFGEPSDVERYEVGEPPKFMPAGRRAGRDRRELSDELAYLASRERVRSAGFFLGLFFFVALIFGALSVFISNEAVSSADFLNGLPVLAGHFTPPLTPGKLVALNDVTATYAKVKGDLPALVISGNAQNNGGAPLRLIEIRLNLVDGAQHPVAGGSIFAGNNLSDRMIGQMTPRELEFFQKLDPPTTFVLQPAQSVPFRMVFISPPPTVKRFSIAVSKADPPQPAQSAQQRE